MYVLKTNGTFQPQNERGLFTRSKHENTLCIYIIGNTIVVASNEADAACVVRTLGLMVSFVLRHSRRRSQILVDAALFILGRDVVTAQSRGGCR